MPARSPLPESSSVPAVAPALRVRLFGPPQFQSDTDAGEDSPQLHPRKAQELFCYLLLHRDRAQPREALAGLFWQEGTTAQSRKYLRQTLWQLRAGLRAIAPELELLLRVEPDAVWLVSSESIWLDVAAFERAYTSTQDIPGQLLDNDALRAMRCAVKLYTDELLAGWYVDWCLRERERLGSLYLAMLDKLLDAYEARGERERARDYAELALRHDPASERTHQKLMRLHYLAGDRAAALRQYERCATALSDELDAHPGKLTTTLRESILADDADRVASLQPGYPVTVNGHKYVTHPMLMELESVTDAVGG